MYLYGTEVELASKSFRETMLSTYLQMNMGFFAQYDYILKISHILGASATAKHQDHCQNDKRRIDDFFHSQQISLYNIGAKLQHFFEYCKFLHQYLLHRIIFLKIMTFLTSLQCHLMVN